jgi:hypothetical protein
MGDGRLQMPLLWKIVVHAAALWGLMDLLARLLDLHWAL